MTNEKLNSKIEDMENDKYKITFAPELTYQDGFADGYSRAWIECWEHMRQLAQTDVEEESKESK